MWLEFVGSERITLVNSENMRYISVRGDIIFIDFGDRQMNSVFSSKEEAQAVFEGWKLALNGLDFVLDGPIKYTIKPLLSCKNKRMHEYMMQKEFEGDRR